MSPQAATLVSTLVLVVAAIGFDVYCLRELDRAHATVCFPPNVWCYVIVLFTPFGGVAYLKLGRPR